MEFNIADLFESLVDVIPKRTAIVSGERRLTFAELDERSNRIANFLKSRGVGHDDHVGLHLYNGTEYVECMLACFKVRAVPINLNYRYVAAEMRYLFENADLVAVFSQREFAQIVSDAGTGVDSIKTVVLLEDGSDVEAPELPSFDYDTTLDAASPERDFAPRSGDDIYIIYTGGTTGMPKGVMWRQEDVFFAGLQGGNPGGDPIERPEQLAENAAEEGPDEGGVSILPAAPFIHGAAQWGSFICLFTGGKLVLQPGKSFSAKRVCELVDEEDVNTITLVGDAMAMPIADVLDAGDYKFESMYAIASAGAVLSPSVRDKLIELLPDCMVLNSFGSTETGHQGSAYPGSETGQEGRPSFEMDESNTVLDDDFKQIVPGSGVIGKLARKGRLPLGYYNDPKKTAERFVEVDGVRWSLPGDYATIEEDGRITVYGRGSNCINTGGEKVFPEEVEEALKSHPDVFDALVVGLKDEKWMQRVAAVVQPRSGKSPSLDELQNHCRQSIAGYKVPRQLTLVEQVMRMPSGKPDYTWAKDEAGKGL
jgi:acyl-CoA synthetase (AMP-forming)/AMP-acid ligase II